MNNYNPVYRTAPATPCLLIISHIWFISVVDRDELDPDQPIQVNQSKYDDHENEGAFGQSINVNFPHFLNSMCAPFLDCVFQIVQKVQKSSKKALAHLKYHLERYLRLIQATQMIPGPFWTRQKIEAFLTSNQNLAA